MSPCFQYIRYSIQYSIHTYYLVTKMKRLFPVQLWWRSWPSDEDIIPPPVLHPPSVWWPVSPPCLYTPHCRGHTIAAALQRPHSADVPRSEPRESAHRRRCGAWPLTAAAEGKTLFTYTLTLVLYVWLKYIDDLILVRSIVSMSAHQYICIPSLPSLPLRVSGYPAPGSTRLGWSGLGRRPAAMLPSSCHTCSDTLPHHTSGYPCKYVS